MAKGQTEASPNFGVDYVAVFKYDLENIEKSAERLESLLNRLAKVGLASEVREGDNHTLLVLIRVAVMDHMYAEVYRNRVKDWIHGVRLSAPEKDVKKALEQDPLKEAERLRIINSMIENPESEGDAGITPGLGEWKDVEAIFALHDHDYNKQWIKKWSTRWYLDAEDLDEIRGHLGATIGFYFAFTQTYLTFLSVPAAIGLLSWFFLGHFSAYYAIFASVWCIVFVEWWKHKEFDLALRWGTRNVSSVEVRRADFKPHHEETDPVTGEKILVFPARDRLLRQLLQIPFAIAAVLGLGIVIAFSFAIEIFISEVYSGPFKSVLTFLPTIILSTVLPLLTSLLTTAATKMTEFENYETDSQFERALTSKVFVLNFITSYLPVFLTAFVYIPFGSVLVPYLNVLRVAVAPFANSEKETMSSAAEFHVRPSRLRDQIVYFTVTAQIINFAQEVVVPYLKRQGLLKFREFRASRNGRTPPVKEQHDDVEEEQKFLSRVREEAERSKYDVYDDYREMVIQFGYLSLFSVIWPLVPVGFFVNNWIELRADAVKICVEMQRPIPGRTDTIGPWLDALSFMSWLGSLCMAALAYLFDNDGLGPDGEPNKIRGWILLTAIFCSEHLYLGARWLISSGIAMIDSPGRLKARRHMYVTREKYFSDALEQVQRTPEKLADEPEEAITRGSLEEEARAGSLRQATAEERFWSRQRGWRESAKVGRVLIERDGKKSAQEKTEGKKEL